jgi:hypothetical protein
VFNAMHIPPPFKFSDRPRTAKSVLHQITVMKNRDMHISLISSDASEFVRRVMERSADLPQRPTAFNCYR